LSQKWDYKIIRCPLYSFTELSKLEYQLLSTAAMQRLSRIKQLAHTYLVYPSAVHTRLEHSLGTLYIAGRICDQLEVKNGTKKIVRIAALLHDIGHGPFSHIWEVPMRWINGESYSHENVTKLIIENDPQIDKILGDVKQEVIKVFNEESINSDIISGSLDADKLDYLRRDSYHSGVSSGNFDIERIIRTLCKISDKEREYLAIEEKGKEALENYRLARYAMHLQVYAHHTRLVADDMFLRALKLAFKEGCISREKFDTSKSNFVANYLQYDDSAIQLEILNNSKKLAKTMIEDVRNRRLLKRAISVPLNAIGVPDTMKRMNIIEMTKQEITDAEKKIADEVRIDPAYIIVHLQSIKIKLYERFEPALGMKEKPIYVKCRNGTIHSFDEESPISARLTPIRNLYVFCPKDNIDKTKAAAEAIFEIDD